MDITYSEISQNLQLAHKEYIENLEKYKNKEITEGDYLHCYYKYRFWRELEKRKLQEG